MMEYFKFELTLQCKKMGDILLPALFFLITILIMPFTIKPETELLREMVVGLVWTALILSSFLSSEKLFGDDIHDGYVDRYRDFSLPLEMIFFIKSLVFSIVRLIPLIVILPIIGILFHLSYQEILRIIIMLLISAPGLLFFSAFGALLSAGLRNAGLMVFILILPLILPAIIFGASGCDIQKMLRDVIHLPLAFSLFSIVLTTSFSGYLIKIIYAER